MAVGWQSKWILCLSDGKEGMMPCFSLVSSQGFQEQPLHSIADPSSVDDTNVDDVSEPKVLIVVSPSRHVQARNPIAIVRSETMMLRGKFPENDLTESERSYCLLYKIKCN
jgi:hypothetical protein